ncbi:ester cyclase [Micrococcaceae bacterium Sec5.1]
MRGPAELLYEFPVEAGGGQAAEYCLCLVQGYGEFAPERGDHRVHDLVPACEFGAQQLPRLGALVGSKDWATRGTTAWVRFHGRGTNTGPFFGPPSGKPVEVTVIDIAVVVDGRISEHWGVPDRFSLLQQTGVLRRLMPSGSPN